MFFQSSDYRVKVLVWTIAVIQKRVNWSQLTLSRWVRHALNSTLAATQEDQTNNGELDRAKPISLADPHNATIALVEVRHVDVYGSTGSPFDRAG